MEAALAYCAATGCKLIHVMAGLVHQGARRETFVANLKKAARKAAAAGVNVVIEPINRRDIPGYFLNKLPEARAIIHEVGEPNLGLQFDLYHRQVEDGDVAVAIKEYAAPHPPLPDRQPARPRRARRGRLELSLAAAADRRQRLQGLGRLRVQAAARHRRGPGRTACGVTLG